MQITVGAKVIAVLSLISGLSISAVAVYYSVAGLLSIFAASPVPIMIMGIALEVSKLIATIWLKQHWNDAPFSIKAYLSISVIVLMLITSIGIFGYLSKAHLDQAIPTGSVVDKISLLDEKIKTQKENIDAARKALKQMDESVDQTMARSTSEKGATRAFDIRKSQNRERSLLRNEIEIAQREVTKLNEEKAPIASELRKVEAEVGPIKYIAALIYGDNIDSNLLEHAVRWMIILIVIVFDPLAVVLLLASQHSFREFKKGNSVTEKKHNEVIAINDTKLTIEDLETVDENIIEVVQEENIIGGISFPESPEKGQRFMRTDYHPAREFFFNGIEWIDERSSLIDK